MATLKRLTTQNVDEDNGKTATFIAGGTVKSYSYFGKQFLIR